MEKLKFTQQKLLKSTAPMFDNQPMPACLPYYFFLWQYEINHATLLPQLIRVKVANEKNLQGPGDKRNA